MISNVQIRSESKTGLKNKPLVANAAKASRTNSAISLSLLMNDFKLLKKIGIAPWCTISLCNDSAKDKMIVSFNL